MSHATLAALDDDLYPQVWQGRSFENPSALLIALLIGQLTLNPEDFSNRLLDNTSYQEWINGTVFGRYIERSFAAFYRQSEDSFNKDIPMLYRHELMRHARFLPLHQHLFIAGDMPKQARRDKLMITTLNPATAINDAQNTAMTPGSSSRAQYQLIVNQVTINSTQVLGFPIRHNKRTSARTRNEVLILDFKDLRQVDERVFEGDKKSSTITNAIVLRDYEVR